jgi:hypothetical protein
MQSSGSSIYAITAGSQQPVYLNLANASARNMVHLYGKGLDVIPPQRPNGAGLDVYVDQAAQQQGFYTLAATSGGDTSEVALNQDKRESQLDFRDIAALKKDWKGDNIKWLGISDSGHVTSDTGDHFPLWKVCILLAIAMLAMETFLLARPRAVAAA